MGYSDWYILVGHQPVRITDLKALGAWMKDFDHRRVALTEGDGWRVSTVFLALDHWMGAPGTAEDHTPILFETMLFPTDDSWERLGRRVPEWQERYATWDEAAAGHEEMVRQVREWLVGPEPLVRRNVRVRTTKR